MNIRKFTSAITTAAFLVFASLPVSASIVSAVSAVTGGQSLAQGGEFVQLIPGFEESDPDNTVGNNNFDDPNLYGFNEVQNIEITMPLAVDVGNVPLGSTVASHYIFFDPAGLITQIGTVTFDSDIFGIITSRSNLAASDSLANPGVNYQNPFLRGLEGGDSVTITGLQEITVNWRAGAPGDYIRVLTEFSPAAVIPIPAAVWLFGSGLIGLIGFSKRKSV